MAGLWAIAPRIPILLTSLALLAIPAATHAQEPQAIEPDRPDVTNGTHIVDTGLLQVEIGALRTHVQPGRSAFLTPFTARLGMFEWLEARIGADGFVAQSDDAGRLSGFGNVQLGAKLRLWAEAGGIPVLSILPTVNVPTANADKGL